MVSVLEDINKSFGDGAAVAKGLARLMSYVKGGGEVDAGAARRTIVNAIHDHDSSPCADIHLQGTALLRWLSANDNTDASRHDRVPPMEAAVVAMRRHPSHPAVQKNAFAVIWNLAWEDCARSALVNMDGVTLVLKAMDYHSSNAGVQMMGCGALRSAIAACLGTSTDQSSGDNRNQLIQMDSGAIRNQLIQMDAFQLVLRVMAYHEDHAGIQECGLGVLTMIAQLFSNDIWVFIIGPRSNHEKSILETMRNHSMSAGVQRAGCELLFSLVTFSQPFGRKVGAAGGGEVILAAMLGHMSASGVFEKACNAMRSLLMGSVVTEGSAPLSGINKEFIMEFTILGMKAHPCEARVQTSGCALLGVLADDATIKAGIVRKGGVRVILGAMRMFGTRAVLQRNACAVLASLASCNSTNTDAIAREGGIACVLDAMERNIESRLVQRHGCSALAALALFSLVNRWEIGQLRSGKAHIQRALAQHPTDPLLIESAAVLTSLIDTEPETLGASETPAASGALDLTPAASGALAQPFRFIPLTQSDPCPGTSSAGEQGRPVREGPLSPSQSQTGAADQGSIGEAGEEAAGGLCVAYRPVWC